MTRLDTKHFSVSPLFLFASPTVTLLNFSASRPEVRIQDHSCCSGGDPGDHVLAGTVGRCMKDPLLFPGPSCSDCYRGFFLFFIFQLRSEDGSDPNVKQEKLYDVLRRFGLCLQDCENLLLPPGGTGGGDHDQLRLLQQEVIYAVIKKNPHLNQWYFKTIIKTCNLLF